MENSVDDFEPTDDYELKKKCVIIAGLCHDLGHGPFSHLWEHVIHSGDDKTWTHEDQSVKMLEFMIRDDQIALHDDPDMHAFALRLISALIRGDKCEWEELLEPREYYLTEIVSNKFCEIDVDKCDYILRDSHYTKEEISDFIQFMDRAKIVYDFNGTSHVGFHEDDFELVENIFRNRAHLHMTVYQSLEVLTCEKMVKDICDEAWRGGIKIADLPLCDVQKDESAYLQLDDSVMKIIHKSSIDNSNIARAKEILNNLESGKFYKKIWQSFEDDSDFRENIKNKFGDVLWQMKIPKPQIPKVIQFYTNDGDLVKKESALDLSQEFWLILTDQNENEIKNFIDGLNNNI